MELNYIHQYIKPRTQQGPCNQSR